MREHVCPPGVSPAARGEGRRDQAGSACSRSSSPPSSHHHGLVALDQWGWSDVRRGLGPHPHRDPDFDRNAHSGLRFGALLQSLHRFQCHSALSGSPSSDVPRASGSDLALLVTAETPLMSGLPGRGWGLHPAPAAVTAASVPFPPHPTWVTAPGRGLCQPGPLGLGACSGWRCASARPPARPSSSGMSQNKLAC